MENGMSVADAMALGNNGFGGNDSAIWVLFLLFIAGGANGFGGNRDAFSNEFVYTNLNNTVQRGNDFLAQNTAQIRGDLCNGFAGINAGIADSSYKAQLCCCDTNRNIDNLRWENSKNTCDIITAGHNDTQLLLTKLAENEIQSLRDKLQTETLKVSQFEQNQYLIGKICPPPIPAYCVPSPCGC